MNRKSFCIANWKTYLNYNQSLEFIRKFQKYDISNSVNANIIICPSLLPLSALISANNSKNIQFGSQDISIYNKGPYTGESSLEDHEIINCQWSIVGHSERRSLFKETENEISKKFSNIYNSKLNPILCVGETIEQKNLKSTEIVLHNQISSAFRNINFNLKKDILIAYEPVWSIGTGLAASLDIIEENISIIKNIVEKYNTKNCNLYLLYGGSVNESNSTDIYNIDNIDGFLIGSASVKPDQFFSIYKTLLRS